MSKLENKLKNIVNTFNKIDRKNAYEDIKKLSTKYHKNINNTCNNNTNESHK